LKFSPFPKEVEPDPHIPAFDKWKEIILFETLGQGKISAALKKSATRANFCAPPTKKPEPESPGCPVGCVPG
jgi:hypothetical protein